MFVGVNNDSEIQAIHGGISALDFDLAGKIRITRREIGRHFGQCHLVFYERTF
jgi:hypothetical protein